MTEPPNNPNETPLTVDEELQVLLIEQIPWLRSYQITLYVKDGESQWRLSGAQIPLIGGKTLAECIAKVRAWKEGQ